MRSTAPLMAIATQLSSASVEKDMLLANLKVSGEKSKGAVNEMNASTSHLTLPIQAYLPKEAKARSIADFIAACSPRRYGETQRHSSFKEAVPDSLSHRRAAARPKTAHAKTPRPCLTDAPLPLASPSERACSTVSCGTRTPRNQPPSPRDSNTRTVALGKERMGTAGVSGGSTFASARRVQSARTSRAPASHPSGGSCSPDSCTHSGKNWHASSPRCHGAGRRGTHPPMTAAASADCMRSVAFRKVGDDAVAGGGSHYSDDDAGDCTLNRSEQCADDAGFGHALLDAADGDDGEDWAEDWESSGDGRGAQALSHDDWLRLGAPLRSASSVPKHRAASKLRPPSAAARAPETLDHETLLRILEEALDDGTAEAGNDDSFSFLFEESVGRRTPKRAQSKGGSEAPSFVNKKAQLCYLLHRAASEDQERRQLSAALGETVGEDALRRALAAIAPADAEPTLTTAQQMLAVLTEEDNERYRCYKAAATRRGLTVQLDGMERKWGSEMDRVAASSGTDAPCAPQSRRLRGGSKRDGARGNAFARGSRETRPRALQDGRAASPREASSSPQPHSPHSPQSPETPTARLLRAGGTRRSTARVASAARTERTSQRGAKPSSVFQEKAPVPAAPLELRRSNEVKQPSGAGGVEKREKVQAWIQQRLVNGENRANPRASSGTVLSILTPEKMRVKEPEVPWGPAITLNHAKLKAKVLASGQTVYIY